MPCFRFQEFWEVLLVLEGQSWVVPATPPSKYSSRVLRSEGTTHWISSQRHTQPYYTNTSLLSSDGMWACESDFVARGGVPPALFGMALPSNPFDGLTLLESWKSSLYQVRVAYHGTSREAFHAISVHGFKCTLGMLGNGIYVGSFWKACRFAARNQEYQERASPTLIRMLWKCNDADILHFPRKWIDGWCLCGKCYLSEFKTYCAHTYDWSMEAVAPPPKPGGGVWKAGQLFPCKAPSGKWVTQNEEWVLNPECVHSIQQAVQLDMTSIARPHYDPLQRDIRIH